MVHVKKEKMHFESQTDRQLKLYGIDRIVAILKYTEIPQQQLSAWTRQQLKTTVFQSEVYFDLSLVMNKVFRDHKKDKDLNERTVFISDDPQSISRLKERNMAMILGLDMQVQRNKALYESGADIVIDSLEDLDVVAGNASITSFTQTLPSAFYEFSRIRPGHHQRKPLFCFDYDGTLTPIIKDPEKAVIPKETRRLLKQLSHKHRVAIVSGRDLDTLKGFLALDSLIYAGSHGYRISGPDGIQFQHQPSGDLLPRLNEAEGWLSREPELKMKGIEIERKHLAIAIHYRKADPGSYKTVLRVAKRLVSTYREFKIGRGKKIIEILPSMEWHKGKAVDWILKTLERSDHQQYMPIYLGDDRTDENAFRSLPSHGIGILVGDHGIPTAAHCQLDDVWEVQKFLHYLVHAW